MSVVLMGPGSGRFVSEVCGNLVSSNNLWDSLMDFVLEPSALVIPEQIVAALLPLTMNLYSRPQALLQVTNWRHSSSLAFRIIFRYSSFFWFVAIFRSALSAGSEGWRLRRWVIIWVSSFFFSASSGDHHVTPGLLLSNVVHFWMDSHSQSVIVATFLLVLFLLL